MKRVNPYAAGGVIAIFAMAFIYFFSFPVVIWFLLQYRPSTTVDGIIEFYRPALQLAEHCLPYRLGLEFESKLLGLSLDFGSPPPGHHW